MKNGRFAILRIISRLCFYKYWQSGKNVYFVSQVIARLTGEGRREKGE